MSYSFLSHTADVKFRATGSTLEEMFISAANALDETIRGNIKILEKQKKKFEIKGEDREHLLYNFLEEFLLLLNDEDFLTAKISSISIDGNKLSCTAVGDAAKNYKFTNDVKAIIHSEISVQEKEGEFECQVVLDV